LIICVRSPTVREGHNRQQALPEKSETPRNLSADYADYTDVSL
jgi:hypothetical protein